MAKYSEAEEMIAELVYDSDVLKFIDLPDGAGLVEVAVPRDVWRKLLNYVDSRPDLGD
jgi:hypothetical protein